MARSVRWLSWGGLKCVVAAVLLTASLAGYWLEVAGSLQARRVIVEQREAQQVDAASFRGNPPLRLSLSLHYEEQEVEDLPAVPVVPPHSTEGFSFGAEEGAEGAGPPRPHDSLESKGGPLPKRGAAALGGVAAQSSLARGGAVKGLRGWGVRPEAARELEKMEVSRVRSLWSAVGASSKRAPREIVVALYLDCPAAQGEACLIEDSVVLSQSGAPMLDWAMGSRHAVGLSLKLSAQERRPLLAEGGRGWFLVRAQRDSSEDMLP